MQERESNVEARVDELSRRARALRVFLMATAVLMAGLGVWNMKLTLDLRAALERAERSSVRLDSMETGQAEAALRAERDAGRLSRTEERVRRMWGGVRHAELVALRAWIRRVEGRVDSNQDRVVALDRRVGEISPTRGDSLGPSEQSSAVP